MSFRKDASEVGAIEAMMGKNIIVTDNHDWSTEEIVSASIDRSNRAAVSGEQGQCHVRINPMFHWTDDKIKCHLLTCVIALACLRLLEIKVGDKHTAKTIMEQMKESIVCFPGSAKRKSLWSTSKNPPSRKRKCWRLWDTK